MIHLHSYLRTCTVLWKYGVNVCMERCETDLIQKTKQKLQKKPPKKPKKNPKNPKNPCVTFCHIMCRYPVEAGDVIWMPPFVTQWCTLGTHTTSHHCSILVRIQRYTWKYSNTNYYQHRTHELFAHLIYNLDVITRCVQIHQYVYMRRSTMCVYCVGG